MPLLPAGNLGQQENAFCFTRYKLQDIVQLHAEQRIKRCSSQFRSAGGLCTSSCHAQETREDRDQTATFARPTPRQLVDEVENV